MAKMKAILVAVDGSETSDRAVRHALDLVSAGLTAEQVEQAWGPRTREIPTTWGAVAARGGGPVQFVSSGGFGFRKFSPHHPSFCLHGRFFHGHPGPGRPSDKSAFIRSRGALRRSRRNDAG